jgi:predicted metal-binding membrane protein
VPEPVPHVRVEGPGLATRIFSHDQLIVAAVLAAAAGLCWWWLFRAGAAPMPAMGGSMAGMAAAPAVWTPAYLLSAFTMWALMMVAMMLPSAAPMILLYARFARGAGRGAYAGTTLFVFTYLAIWAGFSALAVFAQALLVASGLVSDMGLAVGPRTVAGALLVLAGAWQLSPLKDSCLETCRSPLSFMLRLWRPGPAAALRLGAAHGLYCLGCCWALMLLLFVGGVMNLVWIAALAALVMAEKLAPLPLRKPIAALLILAGLAMVSSGLH